MTAGAAPVGWERAYPRHQGPWTVASPGRGWGRFDPEAGVATPVAPARDPDLPDLARVLAQAEEGGALVAYRVGRRAVVARPEEFIKVVRPKRRDGLVAAHQWLGEALDGAAIPVDTPRARPVDAPGAVALTPVAGVSLHHLLRAGWSARELAPVLDAMARALAALHTIPPPPDLGPAPIDDPARWVDTVARADPDGASTLAPVAAGLSPLEARPEVVTHGDLHDKNLFWNPHRDQVGGGVGLIDLDGVGLGAREDDVANLGVHLQLRALQGARPAGVGTAWRDRLHRAYRTHLPLDPDRVAAVEAHTWFRLACLYRFRAASCHLVPDLLRQASAATTAAGRVPGEVW